MNETKNIIDRQTLKTASGEFDVESIHTLSLNGNDYDDLGWLGECIGLERLDLSCNKLTSLYPLANLTNLIHLDLTDNRIILLDGIQTLDNLRSLQLSGNLIQSIDTLRVLAPLEQLSELRLHDPVKSLSNPLCKEANYRSETIRILPKISRLDGEKLAGPGSEFFQICSKLDSLIKAKEENSQNQEIDNATRWTPNGFWDPTPNEIERENKLKETEKKLQDMLEEFNVSHALTERSVQAALKAVRNSHSM